MMTQFSKQAVGVVLGLALVMGIGIAMGAAGDRPPQFTVVATDGSHLIVTDNHKNKLYYYAIDKDGKIGDPLKLRGSIELGDVGKPTLKPTSEK